MPDKPVVRAATPSDRQRLATLVHFETRVHRHLDWRPPLDWLGSLPYLVVESGQSLLAALACPPDPPGMAWIRLFAVGSELRAEEAWQMLWPTASRQLEQQGIQHAAAIALQAWFGNLLEASQFVHLHDVVMLVWEQGTPAVPAPLSFSIVRPMQVEDLPAVQVLDAAAFGPVWRNSLAGLEMAFEQAAVASVVENEAGIIGYQISTAGPYGGHLARLAVHPSFQGQGIGYTIVCDTLDQFTRRGVMRVSVNTQHNNEASLTLYQQAGFHKTGEAYRVYEHLFGGIS